jgi:hypothetical protein
MFKKFLLVRDVLANLQHAETGRMVSFDSVRTT